MSNKIEGEQEIAYFVNEDANSDLTLKSKVFYENGIAWKCEISSEGNRSYFSEFILGKGQPAQLLVVENTYALEDTAKVYPKAAQFTSSTENMYGVLSGEEIKAVNLSAVIEYMSNFEEPVRGSKLPSHLKVLNQFMKNVPNCRFDYRPLTEIENNNVKCHLGITEHRKVKDYKAAEGEIHSTQIPRERFHPIITFIVSSFEE